MSVVKIEPTKEHPVPYDTTAEKTNTLLEEMAVAGNTAELQVELGAPLDLSEKDAAKERELLDAVAKAKKPANEVEIETREELFELSLPDELQEVELSINAAKSIHPFLTRENSAFDTQICVCPSHVLSEC